MDYRKLPHGNEKVSTLGIGSGSLKEITSKEIEDIVTYGMEEGVNLIDTVMYDTTAAEPINNALKGHRDDMLMQIHLGVWYPKGTYSRTRVPRNVKKGFEQELKKYSTNYADIGLISYVDRVKDFEKIMSNGIFDYAKKLKQDGTIRYLGISSHSEEICKLFIETGEIDVIMFSINAAYDFKPSWGKLNLKNERMELYQECEKQGVALTVMKAYGGGQLLNEKTSPFNHAMTVPQCIQYALDRPGVVSCISGVSSKADLDEALKYYSTSEKDRDYSFIASLPHRDIMGTCIYCNHCQPCPSGIDIGIVNKYLDLAKAGDELAKDHYLKLSKNANDCTNCGFCEKNCPFHVDIRGRMLKAKNYFDKTNAVKK